MRSIRSSEGGRSLASIARIYRQRDARYEHWGASLSRSVIVPIVDVISLSDFKM